MLELDAMQVMLETEWLDLRTDVTLVSEDTYWRLYFTIGDTYGDDVRGGDKGGGHVCWQGGWKWMTINEIGQKWWKSLKMNMDDIGYEEKKSLRK